MERYLLPLSAARCGECGASTIEREIHVVDRPSGSLEEPGDFVCSNDGCGWRSPRPPS